MYKYAAWYDAWLGWKQFIAGLFLFQQALSAYGNLGNLAYPAVRRAIIAGCEKIIGKINEVLNQLPIARVDKKADPFCSGIVNLQAPQVSFDFLSEIE